MKNNQETLNEIIDDLKELHQIAIEIADRYIGIQECDNGYDYTIYGPDYKEIDGGVYDNPDISIREALNEIIDDLKELRYDTTRNVFYRTSTQGKIMVDSIATNINYDDFIKKVELAEQEQIAKLQ